MKLLVYQPRFVGTQPLDGAAKEVQRVREIANPWRSRPMGPGGEGWKNSTSAEGRLDAGGMLLVCRE